MTEALPIQQNERVVVVDMVRGFALTGVLIANFTSYTDQQLPSYILDSISSPLDKTLSNINTVFLEWKFMTLFSILFGYGFGLIMTSLEKKNINVNSFFVRRMFWLFVIGIIHTFFWWGDVLHFYAISGALLLLFRKSSTRNILLCSVLLMFVVPTIITFLTRNVPDFFTDENLQVLYEQYRYGTIADVFRMNVILYYKAFIVTGGDVHDVIETLGRFLFGYFLLRIRLFESVESKKYLFRRVLAVTAPLMIGYFIIRWMILIDKWHIDGIYREPVMKIGIISTTCFYVSLLVLSFVAFGQNRFFNSLQALGKMTLTNYLLISAFLITLLYGIGFGQLGELTMHEIWLYALAWLIVEILFSTYWLSKFRYGPMEWIWRQFSYRKRMALRK
ncbi:MAG TPA: DUF418 domain-containing protein [Chitinophagales bacterium]|nr:DUF418 domain-containing protein [Chitinophagales bacterium]